MSHYKEIIFGLTIGTTLFWWKTNEDKKLHKHLNSETDSLLNNIKHIIEYKKGFDIGKIDGQLGEYNLTWWDWLSTTSSYNQGYEAGYALGHINTMSNI